MAHLVQSRDQEPCRHLCRREKGSVTHIQASWAHGVPFQQISTFCPRHLVKSPQPVPSLLVWSASLHKVCREGVHVQLHRSVSCGTSWGTWVSLNRCPPWVSTSRGWLGQPLYLCSPTGIFCSQHQALRCCRLWTGQAAFAQLFSLKTKAQQHPQELLGPSSQSAGLTWINSFFQCINSSQNTISRPSCPEKLSLFYFILFHSYPMAPSPLYSQPEEKHTEHFTIDPTVCLVMDLRCICSKE